MDAKQFQKAAEIIEAAPHIGSGVLETWNGAGWGPHCAIGHMTFNSAASSGYDTAAQEYGLTRDEVWEIVDVNDESSAKDRRANVLLYLCFLRAAHVAGDRLA
jgi:hypothetical protein